MRILVTGANGLLGQKLIQLLAGKTGLELHVTGRGENRNKPGNYEYHKVDLAEEGAVHNLFQQEIFNAVIHTAAMTHVDHCEQQPEECRIQNVMVVESIVRACEHFGCFLTHVSTDFIFDGESGPYSEEAKPNPLSEYGRSKLEAEEIVRSSRLDWAIARTILVYGQNNDADRSNIVLWIKKSLENSTPISLVTDQWRNPTLAEDLALGCWLMTEKKAKGIFNISGSELVNPYQLGLEVARVFELDESLISPTDGTKFTQPAKRPPRTGFILDKAIRELGFQPRSVKEGLLQLKSQLA